MVRTLLKPLSFLPALLLMYVIYNFSAQPADVSSQLSFQVSCKIVEAADYVFDANLEQWEIEDYATRIHFITRKLAHMTIYFALAVAVSFPLYVYGVHGIWLMLLAGLICVGFACGDEYHQSFVDGRSPSPKDVAIDGFGVFWGIILVRIIGWTGRKTIFRPRRKKNKNRSYAQRPQDMPYCEEHPSQHTPYRQVPPQDPRYMPYRQVPPQDPRYMPYRQAQPQDPQHMPYRQAQPQHYQHDPQMQQAQYHQQTQVLHQQKAQQMPLDAPYQQFQKNPSDKNHVDDI